MTKNSNKNLKITQNSLQLDQAGAKERKFVACWTLQNQKKSEKNQYYHKMQLSHPPCFVFSCPIEYWHCAYIKKMQNALGKLTSHLLQTELFFCQFFTNLVYHRAQGTFETENENSSKKQQKLRIQ